MMRKTGVAKFRRSYPEAGFERHSYRIDRVLMSEETRIAGDTLYISNALKEAALEAVDPGIILDVSISVIAPSDYGSYVDTILDVQPIAVKAAGESIGAGMTRTLSGVVLMLCGKDAAGEQISEAGSSEGMLSDTVRFDRPGSIDAGEHILKIDCLIREGERMKRHGPLTCHKAADVIAEAIRQALLKLQTADFETGCVSVETIKHHRRQELPKVLVVKEVMGQGAMHEKLLLPLQPCGITGSRSNIDMGNVPLMLSPLEAIDGGIHALTCVGPSTKETTRHYFRDPLILSALMDEDIDLCGVVFVGSPAVSQHKYMIAERLGALVDSLDVHGVIVATEGYGNNHIDFAAYLEAIGRRGIPAVGVTFCGNFGPLITGNAFTSHLVDCTKSSSGLENSILADNTMVHEDAQLALAMLKAAMNDERVLPPPSRFDTSARVQNLERLKGTGQPYFQSEIPTATLPEQVWTKVQKPLSEMTIALVTGTGVHLKGDQRFNLSCDSSFRIIPSNVDVKDLTVSHGGYDNTDVLTDINSMFPIDRLRELVAEGVIAHAAPRHISFMGGGGDLKALSSETGPAIAAILKQDGVDAAIFTAG